MIADLHAHALPASRDAYDDAEALASACERLGVPALALTDHGPGCDYDAVRAALAERGVALVPGRELNTPIGHVLALTTDIEWLAELPESAHLPPPGVPRGPLALVWAHPAGWRVAGALVAPDPSLGAEHVHAVEVLNGERLWQAGGVELAERLAADLGAGRTGGSDAHRAASAGRCVTVVDGARDAEDMIEGIRAGRSRAALWPGWARANAMTYERADLVPYAEAGLAL